MARFILTAASRYAALSKLRIYYDTSDLDSLTATPVAGVVPIAGALALDMLRRPVEPEASQRSDPNPDDDAEPWKSNS